MKRIILFLFFIGSALFSNAQDTLAIWSDTSLATHDCVYREFPPIVLTVSPTTVSNNVSIASSSLDQECRISLFSNSPSKVSSEYLEFQFTTNSTDILLLSKISLEARKKYAFPVNPKFELEWSDDQVIWHTAGTTYEVTGGSPGPKTIFDHTLSSEFEVSAGGTLYVRIYPFNSIATNLDEIRISDFILLGTYEELTTNPVGEVEFISKCFEEAEVNWFFPEDFDNVNEKMVVLLKEGADFVSGDPVFAAAPSDLAGPADISDTSLFATADFSWDPDAKIIYAGIDSLISLTSVTKDTDYYFRIYNMITAGPILSLAKNVNETMTDNTFIPRNLTGIIVGSAIDLTWTEPTNECVSALQYMVLAKDLTGSGSYTSSIPTGDINTFTAFPDFGNVLASTFDGGQVVYTGPDLNAAINSLTPQNNEFTFKVFAYNNIGINHFWSQGAVHNAISTEIVTVMTQVVSDGSNDYFEFLTLDELDISAWQFTSDALCINGRFYITQSTTSNTLLAGLTAVPEGTFVRIYNGGGTDDIDYTDGVISIYNSGLTMEDSDQLIAFTGTQIGDATTLCVGAGTNPILFGADFGNGNFNYGETGGWLTNASSTVTINRSFAPSVSSKIEFKYFLPNYRYSTSRSIEGDSSQIASELLTPSNFNPGTGTTALYLKDIKYNEPNFTGGSIVANITGTSTADVYMENVTISDSIETTRYMLILTEGLTAPDFPADRYTCYAPSLDFTLAPDLAISFSGESDNDPCGTPTAGNGKVLYIGEAFDIGSPLSVSGLECGTDYSLRLVALNGNGYTSNISTTSLDLSGTTQAVPVTWYPCSSGFISALNWSNTAGCGDGGSPYPTFNNCDAIVVDGTNAVIQDVDLTVFSIDVEANASFIAGDYFIDVKDDIMIEGELTSLFGTAVDLTFSGNTELDQNFGGAGNVDVRINDLTINNIQGEADNDVIIDHTIHIENGVFFTSGDLEIGSGDTLILLSETADNAAFIGPITGSSDLTGDIQLQRFLPAISTEAPSGSGNGVGFRFVAAPVVGATFAQFNNDGITVTGVTGSGSFENHTSGGYYFPSIQFYDESVYDAANSSLRGAGYDGDWDIGNAPNIRRKPNITDPIPTGTGVLWYLGPVPTTFAVDGEAVQGQQVVNLSFTSSLGTVTQDGWNLIANPYPCPVDWSKVSITGNASSIIYMYDATGSGQYITLDNNVSDGTQIIAAGQSFWAKAAEAGTSFTFTELAKEPVANASYYKDLTAVYADMLKIKIVKTGDSTLRDETTIRFAEEATIGFENAFDGYKNYSSLNTVPGLSTIIADHDADICINAIPHNVESISIPFKAFLQSDGEYGISFTFNGDMLADRCITLEDTQENVSYTIEDGSDLLFDFLSNVVTDDARFLIHISAPLISSKTDVSCFDGADGTITAEGIGIGPFTYEWYNDFTGDTILSETLSGPSTITDLAYGPYSLSIDGNSTSCETMQKEFFLSQPAAYTTDMTKVDPSCGNANGSITLNLDEATLWDVNWLNLTTNVSGQISQTNAYVAITELNQGEYIIEAQNECESINLFESLVEVNDVVSDFYTLVDTVYIADGGNATFYQQAENADQLLWIYDNSSEEGIEFGPVQDGQYQYTAPGVYNVTLVAMTSDGCNDYYEQEIVVMGDPSDVNEIENGLIRSYISYGDGDPKYVIELAKAKRVSVQMVNAMGQVLNVQDINVDGKTYVDLPTNGLSSGIYLIITLDDGTRIDTKKLFVK